MIKSGKRHRRILCFGVLIFVVIVSSCKKEPFDYRNKFWGTYFFTTNSHSWVWGEESNDTTIYYQGTITYEKKWGDDSTVIIDYLPGDGASELKVNESGDILSGDGGNISNPDSVYFSFHTGGLGGGSVQHVTGKKID